MIKELKEIGFFNVGDWVYKNETLKHSCTKLPEGKNALYAFVMNEAVLYVGKTTNTLKKRLSQYEKAHSTQRTNLKIHDNILELLKKKERVEIYVFVDSTQKTIGRFELNLSAGLEDSIINTLNPKWNNMGKNKIGEEAITSLDETPEQMMLSNYNTYKSLQKLGYSKAKICAQLFITEEELLDLETYYHELTGK